MSEAQEKVIATIATIFRNKKLSPPEITPDTVLDRTLGLESIDFAELVVRLEGEFGFDPFSLGAVGALRTVADLAALYEKNIEPAR